MAELNLNQIAAKLNEAFTGDARQLIFWYDENGEFSDGGEMFFGDESGS